MFHFLIALIILCVTYVLIQFKKPKNYPPGPPFYPFMGHFYTMKNLSKIHRGQHFAMKEMAEKYNSKTLGLKFGDELTIVVQSYSTIKQVLSEDDFNARPNNFFMKLRTLGMKEDLTQFILEKFRTMISNFGESDENKWKLGITGNEGEAWKVNRNFVSFHLKNSKLSDRNISKLIKIEVRNFIKKIPSLKSDIEMKNLFTPIIISLFWNFTTGSKIEGNNPRIIKMIELLDERNKIFDLAGGLLVVFPWLRFVMPKQCGYDLICKLNEELGSLLTDIIEEHYETWKDDRDDDFIYAYITQSKKSRSNFSDDDLKVILLDIFIAASQTTSSTLSFMIMMMILRPDIQQKIYYLLKENFEENQEIDFSDRHKVPFIEAFIMEIQRYFSITPIIGPRRVLRDTIIDNYEIPKNTSVLLNIYPIHHDKYYWKNPEDFQPERFIDESGKLINHEYFMPFGLGKRRCLGDIAARNCLFNFFVETVRNFKIVSSTDGNENPSLIPKPGIVLSPQPYQVEFIKRDCNCT